MHACWFSRILPALFNTIISLVPLAPRRLFSVVIAGGKFFFGLVFGLWNIIFLSHFEAKSEFRCQAGIKHRWFIGECGDVQSVCDMIPGMCGQSDQVRVGQTEGSWLVWVKV